MYGHFMRVIILGCYPTIKMLLLQGTCFKVRQFSRYMDFSYKNNMIGRVRQHLYIAKVPWPCGLYPDGTKPLLEPLLIYHLWHSSGSLCLNTQTCYPTVVVVICTFEITATSPRRQWVRTYHKGIYYSIPPHIIITVQQNITLNGNAVHHKLFLCLFYIGH